MLYGKQERNTGSGRFGRWLNNEMEKRGYSRQMLANRIGVSSRAVLYYVEGKRFPKISAMLKLVEVFQCDKTVQDIYEMIEEDRKGVKYSKTRIGTWIFYNMLDLGTTQTELAKRIGVSQSSISMHVNGRALPSAKTIDRYCAVFGEKDLNSIYNMVLEDMYPKINSMLDDFTDTQKAVLFLALNQSIEEE